ncbi:MAG TPA: hypothetical protein VK395_24230 [Gemmataceae bacterium]|nr:hypothetical protein [Gemmataceae bacterium]
MRCCFRWGGAKALLALLLIFSSAFAEQDVPASKDTSTKSSSKDKKEPKPKPITSKPRFPAKLIQVEGAQRYLTVQVTQKIPQQNLQAAANLANLRGQLLTTRDPNQIRNISNDIARNQQNLVTYKDDVQKLEIEAPDDMKVRTRILPVDYDDKGKVRRLTEKEKKELRGPDPSLPGYTADFDSLKPDQMVEIYLAKSDSSSNPKPKDKKGTSDQPRLKALMIVINSEPQK